MVVDERLQFMVPAEIKTNCWYMEWSHREFLVPCYENRTISSERYYLIFFKCGKMFFHPRIKLLIISLIYLF